MSALIIATHLPFKLCMDKQAWMHKMNTHTYTLNIILKYSDKILNISTHDFLPLAPTDVFRLTFWLDVHQVHVLLNCLLFTLPPFLSNSEPSMCLRHMSIKTRNPWREWHTTGLWSCQGERSIQRHRQGKTDKTWEEGLKTWMRWGKKVTPHCLSSKEPELINKGWVTYSYHKCMESLWGTNFKDCHETF